MNEFNNQENEKTGVFSNIKSSFSGRKFRSGAYASLITAILLVMLLVINLIMTRTDLKIDLSTQNFYTLTEPTVKLVKGIDDDITIYYLVETGKETELFRRIAGKYASLSSHIEVVQKDPLLYPKFASQYVEDEVAPNSFLVVNKSDGRARYIAYEELLVREFSYDTFDYKTTGIDVEGKLTSALQYVSTEDVPVLYRTTGHTEKEIGEIFSSVMEKQNVTVKTTPTLTISSIPEDCDVLLINSPESDFSEDEITMIKDYMTGGGNVVLVVDYMAGNLPNLKAFLEYYGVEMKKGIVFEGDSNKHAQNTPHYLVPDILSHEITAGAIENGRYIIMPVSSGLQIIDNTRSSLTVKPLLKTSDKAYSKVGENWTTNDKEAGDIDGPFYLGLVATDTFKGVSSNLVVYSAEFIFDDASIQSFGNYDALTGTVNYLAGDAAPVSVRTRSLIPEALRLTQKQTNAWGAVVIFILPLFILSAGAVVCLRRRKR